MRIDQSSIASCRVIHLRVERSPCFCKRWQWGLKYTYSTSAPPSRQTCASPRLRVCLEAFQRFRLFPSIRLSRRPRLGTLARLCQMVREHILEQESALAFPGPNPTQGRIKSLPPPSSAR